MSNTAADQRLNNAWYYNATNDVIFIITSGLTMVYITFGVVDSEFVFRNSSVAFTVNNPESELECVIL